MFSIAYRRGDFEVTLSADTIEGVLALDDAYTTEEVDDDGWITWNGGECPEGLVYSGTKVDVRLRSGDIIIGDNPEFCYWYHDNAPSDIIAYKVVKNA